MINHISPSPVHPAPPPIALVREGVERPLWSVMVPSFNCARYLRETLESVLAQDPGGAMMQIEVIDDCSTADDPKSVVEEVGRGRVSFFRQPVNRGATANFNSCLERARGHLVHVLHGDDFVASGFYQAMGDLAQRHPQLSLFAARAFLADEDSAICGVGERCREMETACRRPDPFFYETPIQFAGAVLRREFVEEHGGFDLRFTHLGDRDMWLRATAVGGGSILLKEPLAYYRVFANNDSSGLKKRAENIRDIVRFNEKVAARFPEFDAERARRICEGTLCGQAEFFSGQGLADAAEANWSLWREITPFKSRLRVHAKRSLRRLFNLID